MKKFAFLFLLLSACSVAKHDVMNRPPQFPDLSGKLSVEFGVMDPMVSLSAFFWPETRNGQLLTMSERQSIVAQVNRNGFVLDQLTDQQEVAQKSVCSVKFQLAQASCYRFDADEQEIFEPDTAQDACELPWIAEWRNEDDPDLAICQELQSQGQEQEHIPDQIVPQKLAVQQTLIQLLETEPGQTNFMYTDPANSKLEMLRDEEGQMQFRIKLAFVSPSIIYDSEPAADRGLIDHIEYDSRLKVLRFQMREKVNGLETGGIFNMQASRIFNTNGSGIVRLSGEMVYHAPNGRVREGRFKIDGYF